MDINQIPLIQQCVYTSDLINIHNGDLIEEMQAFYSNVALASSSSDMRFPNAGPQSEKLQEEIGAAVNAIAGKEMTCREFWMFSMPTGGSVPLHNHWTNYQLHPEEYFSIAYYPCVPNSGPKLHFTASYCRAMKNTITIQPRTGMLIVFNSFLDHYTDKNHSSEQRTCISANYKPVAPDKSLVSDWTSFALPKAHEDARFSKFS